MGEFTPITTQEDFDAAISKRLARQESAIRGEYAESMKELEALRKAAEGHAEQIAALTGERDAAALGLSKVQIAHKYGIDIEDASRLQGSTAEELEADAKAWSERQRSRRTPVPAGSNDGGDNKNKSAKANALAALRELRSK